MTENVLLSHASDVLAADAAIAKIRQRIIDVGDKSHVTVACQLELLAELASFDLGLFLIQHGGLNGYWTHYVLTHPQGDCVIGKNNRSAPLTILERQLLEKFPTTLATQQRFKIFLQENQKALQDGACLATIPCGLMGELLCLDCSGVTNFELTGIDLDAAAMDDAKKLVVARGLEANVTLLQQDAWKLGISNRFHLISSNGLNIYEPNHERVTKLFQQFYEALLPCGKLVTSFLTYPPSFTDKTEWRMEKVDAEMLLVQRIVFSDIVIAKFNCFTTTQEMVQLLDSIGFKEIKILPDVANIFPTVVAYK